MKKTLNIFALLFMLYTGLTWGVVGVVINSIAENLNVSNSAVVASFAIFSFSITIMVIFSTGVLVEYFSLKKTTLLASVLSIAGAVLLYLTGSIMFFKISLLFFGIGYGMCFALSYYFIVLTTNNNNRASKMALVSFFFSIGTALSPIIGGYMIEFGFRWQTVFTCFTIIMIPVALFTLCANFTNQAKGETTSVAERCSLFSEIKTWPSTVYVMAIGLLVYMLAETTMITWLVVYGQEQLHLKITTASKLLSIFWGSVIMGRIIASYVLKKISPETYIIGVTAITGILLLIFSFLHGSLLITYILIALIGIGYSALYSTITSLGTTQISIASPRLVSLLLGAGGCGTIAAPLITSIIKSMFGLDYVFFVCSGFMFIITLLTLFTIFINYKKVKFI